MSYRRTTVTISVILFAAGLVFLSFPRSEYRFGKLFQDALVFSAGTLVVKDGREVIVDAGSYIFDKDSHSFLEYSGHYLSGVVQSDYPDSYNIKIWSPSRDFYIEKGKCYTKNGGLVGVVNGRYIYWTTDGKYLVYLNHMTRKKGYFTFEFGESSMRILELGTGNLEQVRFDDPNHPNRKLLGIVGVAE